MPKKKKIKYRIKDILKKYADDLSSECYAEYYTQANNFWNRDNSIVEYIEKRIVPYND